MCCGMFITCAFGFGVRGCLPCLRTGTMRELYSPSTAASACVQNADDMRLNFLYAWKIELTLICPWAGTARRSSRMAGGPCWVLQVRGTYNVQKQQLVCARASHACNSHTLTRASYPACAHKLINCVPLAI